MSVSYCLNPSGNTALHYASQGGCRELVKLLLSTPGIRVSVVDDAGRTPLHLALAYGHAEVASMGLLAPPPSFFPSLCQLSVFLSLAVFSFRLFGSCWG